MTNPNTPTIDAHVRACAAVLWSYHALDKGIQKVDFILALGSHDTRVAQWAAKLMVDGWAPFLVTSGGFGKVTRDISAISEGERFAQIAEKLGVPREKIVVEPAATNTGANIVNTRELLKSRGITVASGLLVTKPYMRRRAYAAAAKQWPEINWFVSAPDLSFEEYPDEEVPELRMIELMVGDLQRMEVYARQGFQIEQSIPEEVWSCYHELVKLGFNKYVIKETTL